MNRTTISPSTQERSIIRLLNNIAFNQVALLFKLISFVVFPHILSMKTWLSTVIETYIIIISFPTTYFDWMFYFRFKTHGKCNFSNVAGGAKTLKYYLLRRLMCPLHDHISIMIDWTFRFSPFIAFFFYLLKRTTLVFATFLHQIKICHKSFGNHEMQ